MCHNERVFAATDARVGICMTDHTFVFARTLTALLEGDICGNWSLLLYTRNHGDSECGLGPSAICLARLCCFCSHVCTVERSQAVGLADLIWTRVWPGHFSVKARGRRAGGHPSIHPSAAPERIAGRLQMCVAQISPGSATLHSHWAVVANERQLQFLRLQQSVVLCCNAREPFPFVGAGQDYYLRSTVVGGWVVALSGKCIFSWSLAHIQCRMQQPRNKLTGPSMRRIRSLECTAGQKRECH